MARTEATQGRRRHPGGWRGPGPRTHPPRTAGKQRGLADARLLAPATVRLMSTQRWEYATVPLLVHATKQILDTWGEDGWELVAVVPGPNSEQLVAYLKRPKG